MNLSVCWYLMVYLSREKFELKWIEDGFLLARKEKNAGQEWIS